MPQPKERIFGLVCLLGLILGAPLLGQRSMASPNSNDESSSSKVEPWFEPPGTTGIKVATIPRPADDQAEFAILRLTVEKYNEFQNGPREFLNKLKIFKYDIRDLGSCTAEKPTKAQPKADAYWFIIVPHWPGSKAVCQAYPDWDKPKEKPGY